jgi:uncharacterized membrane protein YfcA
MISFITSLNYSALQWVLVIVSCICFGISKTGLNGISMAAVPLFALVFGAKASTGVILPLLCFADLIAVAYYRRHAEWKYVLRLLPWALAGFGLALLADSFISSDKGFKLLMGVCILASLAVMFWNDHRAKKDKKADADSPQKLGLANSSSLVESAESKTTSSQWYSALFGILGGFSTMIGNTAGPIMSIFLLSMHLPKESFVGTAAWFFLIVNYLKIPLQVFLWHNISLDSLKFDLVMIPCILIGIWLGILFVKKVSDAQYRIAVYVLTLASALLLII